jgi:hydroxymethylbilane synthase
MLRVRLYKLLLVRPLMGARIRIGTRGSALALWQASWVKDALAAAHPGIEVALHVIKTRGDKILDVPLAKVGGKGLFVKEIEEALLSGTVDIAVHSMKDMPAELPQGLAVGAVPEREDPRDVLVARDAASLAALPRGARVGTSSLRRAAQLLHKRPDLAIAPLRGNLETRLNKIETEGLDAVVLAAAGMARMGYLNRVSAYLPVETMLPAVAQGALCVECRAEDTSVLDLLACLEHSSTRAVVLAERAFLQRVQGGCQVPVAAHGTLKDGRFAIEGLVSGLSGAPYFRDRVEGPVEKGEDLGRNLAERLLQAGGQTVLDSLAGEGR